MWEWVLPYVHESCFLAINQRLPLFSGKAAAVLFRLAVPEKEEQLRFDRIPFGARITGAFNQWRSQGGGGGGTLKGESGNST